MFRAKSVIATLGLSALILGPLAPAIPFFGADAAYAKNGNGNGGNGGGNGNGSGGKNAGNKSNNASHSSSKSKSKSKTAKVEVISKGKLASELKGMNAVKANPNALANASPNSQVGRIAAYREAALAAQAAGEDLSEAQQDLLDATDALNTAEAALIELNENYTGRTAAEIAEDIAALDPASQSYGADLEALSAEKSAAELHEMEVSQKQADIEAAAEAAAIADAEAAQAEESAIASAAAEEAALLEAANGRVLSPEAVSYVRDQLGLEQY
jgi:hypothetical protein